MQLKTTLIGSGTLALAASLTLGRVARAATGNPGGSKGVLELTIFPNTSNAVYHSGDNVTLVG